MTEYFHLTPDQQRVVIEQTALKCNLTPQAVEKDLWVTALLQLVFSLPIAEKMIWKGGTSLAKAWNCINRMSEDIDLAVEPSLWGFSGDLTKKQVKQLRKQSSVWVRDEFARDLEGIIRENGLGDTLKVVTQPDGEGDATYPEPRQVHVRYPSLLDNRLAYLEPEVLLEIGARSLLEPHVEVTVNSLASQTFPEVHTEVCDALIPTATAEKTFLEKAFLLHELFSTDLSHRAARKSRHLYDLDMMMQSEIAEKALADESLWRSIHRHRQTLTSMRGVDYNGDIRSRIVLVPPKDILKEWEEDYAEMRSSMICGDAPTFQQLTEDMLKLEERFHKIGNTLL
ncbi:MAG: nucleotidyl transferase AbiEii/AbiGii toxin family protein [Bacteroidales bacterium]|nr:nucleotidyl transferase AbiEii/AbiGii toxin family protein [Bacteroidales bacterium]MCD8394600.1 nucleotidyl transferase AbiEii/AbiGii toxin family protein [Bacteroidales bacterium]